VHVGRNWYLRKGSVGATKWQNFLQAFSFASIRACRFGCRSTDTASSSHSKWVTVSKFRGGGSGVLSMSANISTQQFSTGQTGIFESHNADLYKAFIQRFANYDVCATQPLSTACGKRSTANQPAARWQGGTGVYVYFAPVSTDPVAAALQNLHCTPTHRTIEVMSLYLTRPAIISALTKLRASGCAVHVLLEHHPNTAVQALHPRCIANHSKTLTIDAGTVHKVISGAESMSRLALRANDNQMVRTSSSAVVHDSLHLFATLWSRAGSCP
jgi:hypothetical protein